MRQPLIRASLFFALLVSCIHCDVEPSVEDKTEAISADGLEFIDSIVGRWKLSGILNDTCTDDTSVPFPMDETRWKKEGESLQIEGTTDKDTTLLLVPTGEQAFTRTAQVTWNDCTAIQTITVTITNLMDGMMEGEFSAITDVEEGVFCPTDVDTSNFPCETSVIWTALRL